MLIAMESSCIGFHRRDSGCRFRRSMIPPECRQCRLSQAYSSIVRRNSMISPNLQMRRFEERFQILQQKLILEDSAREHDRINAIRSADLLHAVRESSCQASLESAGNFVHASTAQAVLSHREQQGTKVEFFSSKWKWIRLSRG